MAKIERKVFREWKIAIIGYIESFVSTHSSGSGGCSHQFF